MAQTALEGQHIDRTETRWVIDSQTPSSSEEVRRHVGPVARRRATAGLVSKLSIMGWVRGAGPSTFRKGKKEKKVRAEKREGERERQCLTLFFTLLKMSLLTQTPVKALRNQEKDTGLGKSQSCRGRGDPGDPVSPLQRTAKGNGVGAQWPGPNSDLLLLTLHPLPPLRLDEGTGVSSR